MEMLRSEIVVHCPLQWSRIALHLLHSGFRLCPRSTLFRVQRFSRQIPEHSDHWALTDLRLQTAKATRCSAWEHSAPFTLILLPALAKKPSNSGCKRPASQEFSKAQAKRISLHWPLRSHVIGNGFPVGSVAAPPQHVSPMLAL